ncbi:hypothetical protein CKQ79_28900, partial [Klebsiella pneumoniae]
MEIDAPSGVSFAHQRKVGKTRAIHHLHGGRRIHHNRYPTPMVTHSAQPNPTKQQLIRQTK